MAETPPPPRTLNTPHAFAPPASRDDWEARAGELRRRILVSAGLWPLEKRRPPLRPRVTGRTERPDFTVENVALETLPGFHLCGNLYRPAAARGPFPAVVNPHGHWAKGRLHREEDVPPGPPPPAPPAAGRADLVALAVNLARRGFVVFAYDAVGYNDTDRVSHRFAGTPEAWLWGISLLGLQLWNSVRVVDYLESLPGVDRERIGATGASGGASQTFLLAAVDERVRVSVLVNMVSAYMQGGCLCENGPALRVGTDNVEIAALTAPRPQLLVSATGDWSKDTPTVEGPAVKRVYDLYGAGERTAVRRFHYGHNYNRESRAAMYAWFRRWLGDGKDDGAEEAELPFDLDAAAMRVWNDALPRPADDLDDAGLLRALRSEREKRLDALWPRGGGGDARAMKRFRDAALPALRLALGVSAADAVVGGGGPGARRNEPRGALLVHVRGDDRAAGDLSRLRARLEMLEYGGVRVLALAPLDASPEALWKDYFTTYNRAPLGDRVQEIVDALVALRSAGNRRVELIGAGAAGPWALLARGIAPADIAPGGTVADLDRFPWDDDRAYLARLYAPCLRAAGGLRAAALLAAPNPLCLHNAGPGLPRAAADAITSGYRSASRNAPPPRIEPGALTPDEIAGWLTK